jgi:hypothetical protein
MKPRSLKTCFFRGVLLAALALASTTRTVGQEKLKLEPVVSPPLFGTFCSMQRPDYPPLPLHPFPELPLYETGLKHVYWFDDRTVDYAALRKLQAQEAAANTPPAGLAPLGGEEGGGGGMMMMSGGAGLKLTIPMFTNGYAHTTIYDHDPALAYDVYTSTNLNSTTWLFGSLGVIGQTNYYLLQSAFPMDLFLMAASGLDSDADGMADNWEALYGLNPHSATDAGQDADGDGLTNLQEFQRGSDPHSGGMWQVFMATPRGVSALP